MTQQFSDKEILCEIQAQAFKYSVKKLNYGSEIFIKRFMNSNIVTELDSEAFLDDSKTIFDIYDQINNEYGETSYGKTKYDSEMLGWIGYLYRFLCITYNLSSKQAYKLIKPKDFIDIYVSDNELESNDIINHLLSKKNIFFDEENAFNRNLEIFKNIRLGK